LTYDEALEYVIKSYTAGKKRSFDDLRLILAQFGSPQDELRIIHVAGTNGKGSVCAMTAAILKEQGYRTGLYTSPHLHRFNERLAINGETIPDADFAKYVGLVAAKSAELFGGETLSYFQILTVMAFIYFRDQRVDFAVIETGIGGRADSTNIVRSPLVSVITAIGFDHMELLGDTIEKITAEKCGIIKENCGCVLYYQDELVYNIVKRAADGAGARFWCAERVEVDVIKDDLTGQTFSITTELYRYDKIELSLPGGYQVKNTACVLTLVEALRANGVEISAENVLSGLRNTRWPGRMESFVYQGRTVILEGAHNREGMAELVSSMTAYARNGLSEQGITLLIAVLRDKEYGAMLNGIAAICDKIVLTKPNYGVRASGLKNLYDSVEDKDKTIVTERDCGRALDTAIKLTPTDGTVLCAGSLYLVGDVRTLINAGMDGMGSL
jgi:dihydrofolate synthase/folylpolyglutamate synthase